jgi:Rps23 Pro-64 3,4-dihydroxylase Tpa1-like proline 4-hydroxylase
MTVNRTLQPTGLADAVCPHLVFRDVLGQAKVAELIDYVTAHQADFKAAVVRSRITGQKRVDYGLRDSRTFWDLGPFKAPIEAFVRGIVESSIEQLHLAEPALEPKEFVILSYPDGSFFRPHIDTNEQLHKVRVLSCVYYFAVTPRRFSGGELRIYGMPTLSAAKGGAAQFAEIVPETDTMVVFPSWLRHEVRPVSVPSGEWQDSRFTINCWLHRAA